MVQGLEKRIDTLEDEVEILKCAVYQMQCDMSAVIRPLEKSMEDITLQEIKDKWNDVADSYNMRKIKQWPEARRKLVLNLASDPAWVENFDCVLDKITGSYFLQGGSKTDFSATFDWVLKPLNMAKIIEGNYDNKGGLAHVHDESVDGSAFG